MGLKAEGVPPPQGRLLRTAGLWSGTPPADLRDRGPCAHPTTVLALQGEDQADRPVALRTGIEGGVVPLACLDVHAPVPAVDYPAAGPGPGHGQAEGVGIVVIERGVHVQFHGPLSALGQERPAGQVGLEPLAGPPSQGREDVAVGIDRPALGDRAGLHVAVLDQLCIQPALACMADLLEEDAVHLRTDRPALGRGIHRDGGPRCH